MAELLKPLFLTLPGIAVINLLPISSTVITLISIVGIQGCQTALSSYAVITVMPIPNPSIATENDNHEVYVDGSDLVQPLLLDSQISGNYTYQWSLNGILISGADGPTYIATSAGVYSVTVTSIAGCAGISEGFEVFESAVPAPLGDPTQSFGPGATLADVVVEGENIQWYDGADRNVNAIPLPMTTPLINGTTYYASQSLNGHESQSRLAVTVEVTLASRKFFLSGFQYEPNPVENLFRIRSRSTIESVKVIDILGQEVMSGKFDSETIEIDLSSLERGSYFVNVVSVSGIAALKIVKL